MVQVYLLILSLAFMSYGMKATPELLAVFEKHTWNKLTSSPKELTLLVAGIVLGIVGTVLFVILCVHVATDFFGRGHLSKSDPYGLSMLLTSIVACGGIISCAAGLSHIEDEETSTAVISIVAACMALGALIAYLAI